MVLLTIYFQLHQPFRLHPDSDKFLWDEENKKVFQKVAERNYIPATKMFTELIKAHPNFKITMSISGTLLEQDKLWNLGVIKALQELYNSGDNQVEFLDETYYHSLAGLFADKGEFREQVEMHRKLMKELFGISPTSFRNTELIYNNDIAAVVADGGYKSILCEYVEGMPYKNKVYRAKDRALLVIVRDPDLSNRIACGFDKAPLPHQYAEEISQIGDEILMIGFDYEHIGEHIGVDEGIFDYWRQIPEAIARYEGIKMANPSDIPQFFMRTDPPYLDITSTSSWADEEKDDSAWVGSDTQRDLVARIEAMENSVKECPDYLITNWRHLTTSDHPYYVTDRKTHEVFNPYSSPESAANVLNNKIKLLNSWVKKTSS
jgi:alpha-amylase/alpha-mannosidase (GH57 family)